MLQGIDRAYQSEFTTQQNICARTSDKVNIGNSESMFGRRPMMTTYSIYVEM